ncbi:choice-of-anchor M domain-containing protein [Solwaraspora sp. WMMD406]|uniref:choice-of-anchor M domain-containing protein n=1 Tax=Solwaraspora sp. WMMD406 TaxID=3016095 RepID=UPI002415FF08|nr:choice-of-anchor M domain-containing protein [Solwaraspora sp. WMMD406]MDG4767913.1 choice-of-anchor M domain-containing protein [Solwaraspora sp. WMMD406]
MDDGVLALGTKADVAEGTGTRFDDDDVWFHIDDDAARPVPAGYEFIAAAGEQVWIAPESNPGGGQLWPGFSTESVPAGAVSGDQTTFTLSGFDGPGDVELFRTGSFGTPTRLWSSDEDHKTFSVGRTHMHANWAFTAAGTYRLTVIATATAGATPMAATATYTFVVGDLPEVVSTSTALTASATALRVGEPVTLTGTVTPAETDGYVEFRDGGTVLGHAPVDNGSAELVVPDLAVGAHPLTASFVPAVGNLAGGSTSASVAVTVTDDSGVEFGIAGIAESYQPGDLLQARVVGATAVTIHVDDHGAAPRQQVTVTGETSVAVGDVATFTAEVSTATVLTSYQWFEKAPDAAEATPIPGATGREYSFTVTAGHHSRELIVAVVTPTGQIAYGPSASVTLAVDDSGGGVGATSQEVIAAVPDGTLVISVDANDQVLMSDFALSAEADRWVSTGELRPVRVTDARASAPGWTASGQVSDFVADTQTLSGRFLGWTPRVVSQPGVGAVTAGESVAPAFDSGRGLLDSSPLAIGAVGARGTSELGAGLRIEAPTDVAAGTYVATITFTAI